MSHKNNHSFSLRLLEGSNGRGSAARELRQEVTRRVASLLQQVEAVSDSQTRLSMQAACLDIVTGLEDLIERHELES